MSNAPPVLRKSLYSCKFGVPHMAKLARSWSELFA
jgi:hypothetical protein